jgi:hypothetical protein
MVSGESWPESNQCENESIGESVMAAAINGAGNLINQQWPIAAKWRQLSKARQSAPVWRKYGINVAK